MIVIICTEANNHASVLSDQWLEFGRVTGGCVCVCVHAWCVLSGFIVACPRTELKWAQIILFMYIIQWSNTYT